MLQDALFARAAWLAEDGNEAIAVKFLRATFRGWIYCRDNAADCVTMVLAAGSTLGAGHQTWQLNEINALIWPSPDGIGILESPLPGSQTVDTALAAEDHHRPAPSRMPSGPTSPSQALTDITGDKTGTSFKKAVVEITPGGE